MHLKDAKKFGIKAFLEKINDVILTSTSSTSHLGDEWATLNEIPK
jgi:hypothetical protein